MNRLTSTLLSALVAAFTVNLAAAAEPRRPNVVFVLCDDLRSDCLGVAGHPHLKTPNIDRLAGEGVYFKNTFCTTSLCSPSRASILSGLYAHTHGVKDNFTEFPTAMESFPLLLQRGGYETAYVGKWHMGEENDEKRPGFDYFATHKGQGKYFDTEFNVDGTRKVLPGYYTHVVTDLAIDWIQKRDLKKPFLMMVGQKAPHSFYFPEKKYEHAFDSVDIKYPDTAFALEGKPTWIKDRLSTWHGIYGPLFDWRKKFPDSSPEAVKDFAAMTRAYWGTILSVDDSVGRLVEALKARGVYDNTVFVFMGDNGLLNGEHGMVDKRTMHEPSIRIPLIVRGPGVGMPRSVATPVKPGEAPSNGQGSGGAVLLTPPRVVPRDRNTPETIEQQVLTVDIAPSLLELCGLPPLKQTHGRSWVKLARDGEDAGWRTSWFYEYNYEKQFPYTPNVRGVRTDEWKYIHYPHGDGNPDRHLSELYDLKTDPEERENLIHNPFHRDRIAELRTELARLMKETGIDKDTMPLDEGVKQTLPDQKIR